MKAEIILEWMIKIKSYANSIYRPYYHWSRRNMNSQDWMAADLAFKNHKKAESISEISSWKNPGVFAGWKRVIFHVCLNRHNYSIVWADHFSSLFAKVSFCPKTSSQNDLLRQGFVKGISRSPCAPGVTLATGLNTDISSLVFPHHLLLFQS